MDINIRHFCDDDFLHLIEHFKLSAIPAPNNPEGDVYLQVQSKFVANSLLADLTSPSKIREVYLCQKSGQTGCFLVALQNSKLCGCVALEITETGGELRRMYVDPSVRSQQVGDRLVEALLQHAREQQVSRVFLSTPAMNTRGIQFYQRRGFQEYDRVPIEYEGTPLVIVYFQMFLNKAHL